MDDSQVFPWPKLDTKEEEPAVKISVPTNTPPLDIGLIGEENPLLSLDTAEYILYVILKSGVEIEYPISISKTEEEKCLKEYGAYIKSMVQGRLRGVVVATADGRLAFINGEAVAILELK